MEGLERTSGSGSIPHTLSAFDADLEDLRAQVCAMGGRAEAAIGEAVAALLTSDEERSAQASESALRIAEMGSEIEKQAMRVIALRAPRADDLREVIAALKIAGLVARLGNGAGDIAGRAERARECRDPDAVKILANMAGAVEDMVRRALDAFAGRNPAEAAEVGESDQEVDEYFNCVLLRLIDHMSTSPHRITAATDLLFVGKRLERIGDNAAAIARIVHYASTGERLAHGPASAPAALQGA